MLFPADIIELSVKRVACLLLISLVLGVALRADRRRKKSPPFPATPSSSFPSKTHPPLPDSNGWVKPFRAPFLNSTPL